MSTLTVSNVSDGTLSIPTTYVTNGSAKAWANLNGTGTVALRDSFNVTSVTDNGSGDYTYSFSNAMNNANYSYSVTGDSGEACIFGSAIATTSSRVLLATSAGAAQDKTHTAMSIHGDLA